MMFVASLALALASLPAWADSGRFLPRAEDNPRIIAKIFHTRAGEVQVLKARSGEVSAIFRSNTGGLAQLEAVSGPARCGEWLHNSANSSEVANAACTLTFRRDLDNQPIHVDARDLEQGSLFGLVKTTLKGLHGAF